jgi:hypothetical protein
VNWKCWSGYLIFPFVRLNKMNKFVKELYSKALFATNNIYYFRPKKNDFLGTFIHIGVNEKCHMYLELV